MPNFGGSRSGFWYRPPIKIQNKKILFVKEYGRKTYAGTTFIGGMLYKYQRKIYMGGERGDYPYPEPNDLHAILERGQIVGGPQNGQIVDKLTTDYLSIGSYFIKKIAEEMGFQVDIISCNDYDKLGEISAQLSTYNQIWDMQHYGYLNTIAKDNYRSFVQNGGSLFLCGENSSYTLPGYQGPFDDKLYAKRNTDIATFMRELDGINGVYISANLPIFGVNEPNYALVNPALIGGKNLKLYPNAAGAFVNANPQDNNLPIQIGHGTWLAKIIPGSYPGAGTRVGATNQFQFGAAPYNNTVDNIISAFWDKNTMTNAPQGRCIIHLDMNIFDKPSESNRWNSSNKPYIQQMLLLLNGGAQ